MTGLRLFDGTAGAAVVDVTPKRTIDLGGYAARSGPMEGALDSLEVRALVLGDGNVRQALVIIDTVAVDARYVEQLKERVAAAACGTVDWGDGPIVELQVVAATHSHAAPSLAGALSATIDEAWSADVTRAVIEAVRRAANRSEPLRAYAAAAGLGDTVWDRVRERPVEGAECRSWTFRRSSGELVAALVELPGHPTVLGPRNRAASADLNGALRAELERRWPGCTVLVMTGAAADTNFTGARPSDALRGDDGPDRTLERARTIAVRIADAVGHAQREHATAVPSAPAHTVRHEVRLQLATPREARGATPDKPSGPVDLEAIRARRIAALARDDARDARVTLTGAAFGALSLIAVPGELGMALGTYARRCADGRTGVPSTLIAGYANGYVGYLPSVTSPDDTSYERSVSPFDPSAAATLETGIATLAERLGEHRRAQAPMRKD